LTPVTDSISSLPLHLVDPQLPSAMSLAVDL